VSLDPILEVVETSVIGDFSGEQIAGKILYSICEAIPHAVKFFGSRICRGLDGMALFYQRV
jgi:hypothetical protein